MDKEITNVLKILLTGSSMKLIAFYSTLIGTMLISGCANKQEANEKNFSDVISKYVESQAESCLEDSTKYPFDSWDLATTDTNETVLDFSYAIRDSKKDVIDRLLRKSVV